VYVWVLVAGAAVLHLLLVWYVGYHGARNPVPHQKAQLNLEIVPPKAEPPKPPQPSRPPPPRRQARQVLPAIRTATPVATDTPDVPSSEPPVAVAPAAAEPLPPPAPAPVTAPFGKAGYLDNPAPDYPAIGARQGWEGTVTLRVHVLVSGKPDVVEVQKSSGHRPLDEEAMRAVRGWTFAPAKRGDTPIDGWATVPIEFKL
jgi:protein TonB